MTSWVLMAEYAGGAAYGCTFEAPDAEAAEARGREMAKEHAERRGIALLTFRVKKGSGLVPAVALDDAPVTTRKPIA